jgi:hypothetical protein
MNRNEIWNKFTGLIINQLKQGATPQKLAQSISFGEKKKIGLTSF